MECGLELVVKETFRNMLFHHDRTESKECNHRETIIVVEMKADSRENAPCPLCQEMISSPPAFQCLECDLLVHISCLHVQYAWDPDRRVVQQVDEYLQTLIQLCGSRFLSDSTNLDGEKEKGVCLMCNEPLLAGPVYNCPSSCGTLLFHESCAHFPLLIQHPPHDANDALLMQLASRQRNPRSTGWSFPRCNRCRERCINCVYYSNATGNFVLDIACAIGWLANSSYNCPSHSFVTIAGKFHFTCQLCGEKGQDLASQCSICRLFVHRSCGSFSPTIRISCHQHSLVLTFPLRQLKDNPSSSCNICRGKVKVDYAAYCCQVCDFAAHLPCADSYWLRDETADSLEESTALAEMSLEMILHDLIPKTRQLMDDEVCDGCMHAIRAPSFYNWVESSFFLHSSCAILPIKKQHPLHQHTLGILPLEFLTDGIFKCRICLHVCIGLAYTCFLCNFTLDVHCCTISQILTHPSHEHSLFLAIRSEKRCSACDEWSSFLCMDCDDSLCYNCASLPLEVRHEHEEHLLALTYVAEDEFGEYYCLICEKERDSKEWFYYCSECNFSAHTKCVRGSFPYIKAGKAYRSVAHKHSLTFVPTRFDSSPDCDTCGEPFFDGLALECTQCKFNVHFQPWRDDCLRKMSLCLGEEEYTP